MADADDAVMKKSRLWGGRVDACVGSKSVEL